MLALRSAAKKAFDAYKKENGSDKKRPRISELNTEYSMLLERKKSSYAEYLIGVFDNQKKLRSEMCIRDSWMAEVKEELSKPQTPSLADLLIAYYNQRNAGAVSYTQLDVYKRQVSNMMIRSVL